jgi:hypothetical protein
LTECVTFRDLKKEKKRKQEIKDTEILKTHWEILSDRRLYCAAGLPIKKKFQKRRRGPDKFQAPAIQGAAHNEMQHTYGRLLLY